MKSTQRRYEDIELLTLLRIVASDYNRKPTQREVLADDRMPTHHTFNARFGSLARAMDNAGIWDLDDNSDMHKSIKDVIEAMGGNVLDEFVPIGSIIVDFKVAMGDKEVLLDVVNLHPIDPAVEKDIREMRSFLIASTESHPEYHICRNAGDIITLMQ